MEKLTNLKKSKAVNISSFPLLFTIPLNVYSDEMEKERDKDAFIKIQKLEKKCEQLKQKFQAYVEKHSVRIETTKSLVLRTIAVNNSIRGKKTEF